MACRPLRLCTGELRCASWRCEGLGRRLVIHQPGLISRGERVEISGEVLMFLCFREKKGMALVGLYGFTRM